ncbi:MAG: VOC family protein [Sphingobium sp.]
MTAALSETGACAPMIGGEIDHLGIAVPDLAAATAFYRDVLGMAEVGHKLLEADGLAVTFMLAPTPGLSVELISPLPGSRPLSDLLGDHTTQAFLRAQPQGGLHHICFRTHDFVTAKRSLEAAGVVPLGNGKGAVGAAGKPIMFFAPSQPSGVLIELKEVAQPSAAAHDATSRA